MKIERPTWDKYFSTIAKAVAARATCPRAAVGVVIARDNRILTTGYNGSPTGVRHCVDAGCLMIEGHCGRATHAEANAIVQGALHGVSLRGATAYVTMEPCLGCTKLLISAGIARIVSAKAYANDNNVTEMLAEAGIPMEITSNNVSR